MRLAIADPPYPPSPGADGRMYRRASRWYGGQVRSATDVKADVHEDAAVWDDPATHRALLERLLAEYDGFAIATAADSLYAYGALPPGTKLMSWHKPNGQPGAHRLVSRWEPVILYPPVGRRSNRNGGAVSDALVCPARVGARFRGGKPPQWTRWVLDAMSYDPDADTVDDLFPGSGAVSEAVAALR